MASAAAGIWNAHHAAAQLSSNGPLGQLGQLTGGKLSGLPAGNPAAAVAASPADSSSSSSSTSDSSTISSNDFLTLLVTEMQNQDPTADTDPNEYINQLVQINSLEQLIDINQNLETVLGAASGIANSGSGSSSVAPASGTATSTTASALTKAQAALQNGGPSMAQPGAVPGLSSSAQTSSAPKTTQGNLGIPDATPASLQVAQALSGKPHNHSFAGRSKLPR